MPREPKAPPPHLQPVADTPFPLNVPEEQKPVIMAERDSTVIAFRQLGAPVHYCESRKIKEFDPDKGEALHITDPELVVWRLDKNKQGLNAALELTQGVIEVKFFGPDQTLNSCFFAACAKLGISTRYAIGRRSKEVATTILFKLRDDEAKRLDEDYAGFRPKSFTLESARRGVVITYAPPARKNARHAPRALSLLPGSLLWHDDGESYDLLEWRAEAGTGPALMRQTSPPVISFFDVIRAAAYASILNIVPAQVWQTAIAPRVFAHWLARVVHEGQAINANEVFSKASRAILADPKHAENLLALICEQRAAQPQVLETCLEVFRSGCRKLDIDSTRKDVAGWSAIEQCFGPDAKKALRTALYVGADSTLLEDYAERYLFCSGRNQFIDREFFFNGSESGFIFAAESLKLRHAPNLIQTLKKPIEAFPLFIKSKLRQDVTDVETYPDHAPGSIIRLTRQGKAIDDDEYAPEDSRLIFNEWRGLYVRPAKTIDAALKAECAEKLDYMLSLVTNRHAGRARWIKAHMGWTLKHPGKKQQVALVCTGDQGTGKTFLCTTFAQAVFGRYAGAASVRALNGQFYIAGYVGKLWVTHDEFVSSFDNAEILKTLIRGTQVPGEQKGSDTATYTIFARLAFTSNEANPGISKGRDDRGLFQVTSISPASEGLLPAEFQDRMRREVAPFYEAYDAFLQRDDVRAAYVSMLIDCAPSRISEVEDLTHSAMRDADVARKHLTDKQLVAKTILESGVIHGGYDIAMPFQMHDLFQRVSAVAKDMGMRHNIPAYDVLEEFIQAGVIERPTEAKPFLFKYKIGALQRLYGDYLGVPLHSQWKLDALDDRPNDWREGDPMEPWKGRPRDDGGYRDEYEGVKW